VDFHPYHQRSGWLKELERLITDLRRDNLPPRRISVLLLKTPRGDEEKHLERMGLRRLSEDDVPHLRRHVARAPAVAPSCSTST
jgi:hypothetical protein